MKRPSVRSLLGVARQALAAGPICAALLGACLANSPVAHAAPSQLARLSVTLADGVTQVKSDTDVTYTAKVTNQGGSRITATLVISTPAYVTVTGAAGAKLTAHGATWAIGIPAGGSVTRKASAHIGTIAKGEYRVTTLASVFQGKAATGVPLIRTAVANTIVGVKDPARTVTKPTSAATSAGGSSGTNWLLVVGIPVLAILVLAAGLMLWARRRALGFAAHRRRAPARDQASAEPVSEPRRPRPDATVSVGGDADDAG